MTRKRDEASGEMTTGHEWDGVTELDTPIPKAITWWLWLSIAVALAMWLLYPAFPYVSGYTKGFLGYDSRQRVTQQVAEGAELRAAQFAAFANEDIAALAADPTLRARFEAPINVLYRDNCSACHGRDLSGQLNFPDLTDDHWLWSGTPEEIEWTLLHGINAPGDLDTRYAVMSAFGDDDLLGRQDIKDVAEYVVSLTNTDFDAGMALNGAVVFEENCAACHGDNAAGGLENGAPSLIDAATIYGGNRDAITATIKHGRTGVMPAWSERLTPEEIRMLTVYVLWAGQEGANGTSN